MWNPAETPLNAELEKAYLGDKEGWNLFFPLIRRSRVDLTDVCMEEKKQRNFDIWFSSWRMPF